MLARSPSSPNLRQFLANLTNSLIVTLRTLLAFLSPISLSLPKLIVINLLFSCFRHVGLFTTDLPEHAYGEHCTIEFPVIDLYGSPDFLPQ